MVGPTFSSTAHWSMLESRDKVIGKDDLQDTYGHQICSPIAGLPTNEDTTKRAPKKNYKEMFDRLYFVQQFRVPKKNLIGRTMQDSDGDYLFEVTNSTDTVPNIDALHAYCNSFDSHPVNWFNFFLHINKKQQDTPNVITIDDFTTWSNEKLSDQTLEQKVVNTQSGHHSQLKK